MSDVITAKHCNGCMKCKKKVCVLAIMFGVSLKVWIEELKTISDSPTHPLLINGRLSNLVCSKESLGKKYEIHLEIYRFWIIL